VRNTFYFLLFLFLFSCGNKQENDTDIAPQKPLLSVVTTHEFKEKISPAFQLAVADWKALKTLNSFLEKFKKTSPNEALNNALELRDLVNSLKDSVKPLLFNIPSLNARVHVLNNETLRLADLTLISSITAEEINFQIDKTLAAFSAVNSKINTTLSKKRFEEEIDVDFDFIGIDSSKIDSISKNTIDKKREEERNDEEELMKERYSSKDRFRGKRSIKSKKKKQ
jgi:hypothetical protein